MRPLLVTAIVAACALWATPVASAGTLDVQLYYGDYQLVWEGEEGEHNDLVVETAPAGGVTVRERAANARLAGRTGEVPCQFDGDRTATCSSTTFTEYVLRGGEGDDRISTTGLTAGSGYFRDYLYGGAGNDLLEGSDHDYCCSGSTFDGGRGDDVMRGGAGSYDSLNYYSREDDLDISLDPRPAGARNGGVGEHDTFEGSIESIQTGSGDDVVYGSAASNSISSGGGTDRLFGGDGSDYLSSWSGTWDPVDELYGGDGSDSLYTGAIHGVIDGGPGWDYTSFYSDWYMTLTLDGVANDGGIINQFPYWPDKRRKPSGDLRQMESVTGGYLNDFIAGDDKANTLSGYRGSDVIVAGAGSDYVYADEYWNDDAGDDFVDILDGEYDNVTCGGGSDTVAADTADFVSSDCETVEFEKLPIPEIELPPEPPPPPPPPEPTYYPGPVFQQPPGTPMPGQWFETPPPAEADGGEPPRPACAVLEATREPKNAVGGPDPECLVGARGNDKLTGNAGDDQLVGGEGKDRLSGGKGDDWVDGGSDADKVDGGSQDDTILGGLGADSVTAGSGDDVVIAADEARDKIDCGKGRDIVVADRRDRVKHCEVVRRTRRPSR
jgi:Ca2+-binding RTX toxin-like protein